MTVLNACKTSSNEVNEMREALNRSLKSTNDHLLSSTTPTFEINADVHESKGKFQFEPFFSNSMVLQANAVFKFYGSYETDGKIAVTLNGKTFYSEVVNQSFSFYMGPFAYGGPYLMTVYTETSKYTFKDVMIGEVYLMSGQSNMAITILENLRSADETFINKVQQDIRDMNHDKIRFLTVGMIGSSEPHDQFQANQTFPWDVLTPDNASTLSMTAFYFATEIVKQYDIPVGVIVSAVGATVTSTWIPEAEANGMDTTYIKNVGDADTPSRYYNGMVAPLKQFTFRGVVWYQGEGQHVKYQENMTRLINSWRREFNDTDLKFIIIGLPRFDGDLAYSQESWFKVRAQQQALTSIAGVTYSVNIDLGISESQSNDAIHSYDKDVLGMRAAHAFMKAFYDAPGVLTSPKLQSASYVEGKLILKFYNIGEGIFLTNQRAGFEVSTNGTHFSYASPKLIDHETIELETDLSNIIVIRYGYTFNVPEVFGPGGKPRYLSELVCVYNSENYPLDQLLVRVQG